MKALTALVALLAMTLTTAAPAQQRNYDADYARFRPAESAIDAMHSRIYVQCLRSSAGVTSAMRECSSAEYDRVDVRLNANYRQAMGRLPTAGQQRLRTSQRRWLASQWTMCDNLPEYEGGTLDLIIRDSCVLDEITRRTLWLGRL